MSHFQSPAAKRQFWREVGRLLLTLLGLLLMLLVIIECVADRYDKATFFAVLFLWNNHFLKGSSNNG